MVSLADVSVIPFSDNDAIQRLGYRYVPLNFADIERHHAIYYDEGSSTRSALGILDSQVLAGGTWIDFDNQTIDEDNQRMIETVYRKWLLKAKTQEGEVYGLAVCGFDQFMQPVVRPLYSLYVEKEIHPDGSHAYRCAMANTQYQQQRQRKYRKSLIKRNNGEDDSDDEDGDGEEEGQQKGVKRAKREFDKTNHAPLFSFAASMKPLSDIIIFELYEPDDTGRLTSPLRNLRRTEELKSFEIESGIIGRRKGCIPSVFLESQQKVGEESMSSRDIGYAGQHHQIQKASIQWEEGMRGSISKSMMNDQADTNQQYVDHGEAMLIEPPKRDPVTGSMMVSRSLISESHMIPQIKVPTGTKVVAAPPPQLSTQLVDVINMEIAEVAQATQVPAQFWNPMKMSEGTSEVVKAMFSVTLASHRAKMEYMLKIMLTIRFHDEFTAEMLHKLEHPDDTSGKVFGKLKITFTGTLGLPELLLFREQGVMDFQAWREYASRTTGVPKEAFKEVDPLELKVSKGQIEAQGTEDIKVGKEETKNETKILEKQGQYDERKLGIDMKKSEQDMKKMKLQVQVAEQKEGLAEKKDQRTLRTAKEKEKIDQRKSQRQMKMRQKKKKKAQS